MGFLKKLFGDHTDHELKKIYPIVDQIEALEPEMQKLSDSELRAKTEEFKQRYNDGEELDDILPEAYAAVREAAWRVLGMKPFRVQLIGGIVLHQGRIAEMKTGEGKTLVAILPAYLNALTGLGAVEPGLYLGNGILRSPFGIHNGLIEVQRRQVIRITRASIDIQVIDISVRDLKRSPRDIERPFAVRHRRRSELPVIELLRLQNRRGNEC